MRLLLSIFAMLLLSTSQAFGQRTWNNSAADNNFANGANWTGWTGAFTGSDQNWDINLLGANRAILSTAVGNVQRDLRIGDNGAQGELEVTASGSMTVTRDLRLARAGGATGQAIMTVNGGSVTVNREIFIGQSDNPGNPTIFTLNGGSVTNTGASSILNVAHQANNRGNLTINDGTFTTRTALFADGGTGPSTATLTVAGGSLTTTGGGYAFASGNGGATATVNVSGTGSITSATSMSFGFGLNSVANLNMSGGALHATGSFITFGQNATGSTTTVNMTGGTIAADRINWANDSASATLSMSGGVMNMAANPASTSGNRGALVLGSAGADLDLSGLALISAERLLNNAGGSIDLGGSSTLHLKGSTIETAPGSGLLASPTFSFAEQFLLNDWTGALGTINFSSFDSLLRVVGDQETLSVGGPVNFVSLFSSAIGNSRITHNVAGGFFDVGFDGTHSYVRVVPVPEPSSLGMVSLFGLIAAGRRIRGR
jgi:hypothetical protein